jgi:hypothetical protein
VSSETVAIVVIDKPNTESVPLAIKSLVDRLGIKEKTATQIINNIPLKIYQDLSPHEGRILVEALNLSTLIHWKMVRTEDAKIPAVNWNKKPSINGMPLEELISKNDPIKTGVSQFFPNLVQKNKSEESIANTLSPQETTDLPQSQKGKSETSSSERKKLPKKKSIGKKAKKEEAHDPTSSTSQDDIGDSTILRTADSVITNLSADLEEAFQKQTIGMNPNETLPLYGKDSQNIPGTIKSDLEPGFYNLYLPPLKNRELREQVEKMCHEVLNWDRETFLEAMAKPIVCIARNVDDIDASRLTEKFLDINIQLNCKLRSKI